MSSTEGLQIAQVIADLQTLQNAVRPLSPPSSEPPTLSPSSSNSSSSYLSCHSTSSTPSSPSSFRTSLSNFFFPPPNTEVNPAQGHAAAHSLLAPLKSTSPSSDCTNTAPNSSSRRTSSTPKFDKLGRRIVTVPRSQSNTAGIKPPAFTRAGSSFSINSGISTPMRGMSYSNETITEGGDEDLTRARTLLQLFEMRGKFRQMGDTGLSRAKERVDEVVARYAKEDLEEREKVARSRYLGV
ncbi:uncharacterized protein RAG0_04377 [Rhynchosporium agropyri]|uniref:Uncharacterized protein n=1 Tax=Rhynchosporium agropyri TaxID=914238 RepID=A0A1E1K8M3_9HELO|nr:uncharacterized protein RAG0_04377 [Rhynchosporium agropyri]